MQLLPTARRALLDIVLASALCLLSLGVGAGALMLAEFGASAWVFALLLTWLVTIGLPTLMAVLVLATFWPGPSFLAYVVSAIIAALFLQWGMVVAIRRGFTRRRRSVR